MKINEPETEHGPPPDVDLELVNTNTEFWERAPEDVLQCFVDKYGQGVIDVELLDHVVNRLRDVLALDAEYRSNAEKDPAGLGPMRQALGLSGRTTLTDRYRCYRSTVLAFKCLDKCKEEKSTYAMAAQCADHLLASNDPLVGNRTRAELIEVFKKVK